LEGDYRRIYPVFEFIGCFDHACEDSASAIRCQFKVLDSWYFCHALIAFETGNFLGIVVTRDADSELLL